MFHGFSASSDASSDKPIKEKKMLKNSVYLATACTILLILLVCKSFGYSWKKQFITCNIEQKCISCKFKHSQV